jgi:hypothetical protein
MVDDQTPELTLAESSSGFQSAATLFAKQL